jgi:hypothetical protein
MFRNPETGRINRRPLVLAGVVVAGLVAGGIAFAAWSSSPTGAGRSQARTAVDLTVNAVTGAADLYPGTTQGDVHFTLNNPNPYPVVFTSMAPAGPITNSVAGDAAACPPAHVTLTGATGLSLTVAANSTSPTLTIPDVVSMALAAPDGCQGKSFEIPMTLTGASA